MDSSTSEAPHVDAPTHVPASVVAHAIHERNNCTMRLVAQVQLHDANIDAAFRALERFYNGDLPNDPRELDLNILEANGLQITSFKDVPDRCMVSMPALNNNGFVLLTALDEVLSECLAPELIAYSQQPMPANAFKRPFQFISPPIDWLYPNGWCQERVANAQCVDDRHDLTTATASTSSSAAASTAPLTFELINLMWPHYAVAHLCTNVQYWLFYMSDMRQPAEWRSPFCTSDSAPFPIPTADALQLRPPSDDTIYLAQTGAENIRRRLIVSTAPLSLNLRFAQSRTVECVTVERLLGVTVATFGSMASTAATSRSQMALVDRPSAPIVHAQPVTCVTPDRDGFGPLTAAQRHQLVKDVCFDMDSVDGDCVDNLITSARDSRNDSVGTGAMPVEMSRVQNGSSDGSSDGEHVSNAIEHLVAEPRVPLRRLMTTHQQRAQAIRFGQPRSGALSTYAPPIVPPILPRPPGIPVRPPHYAPPMPHGYAPSTPAPSSLTVVFPTPQRYRMQQSAMAPTIRGLTLAPPVASSASVARMQVPRLPYAEPLAELQQLPVSSAAALQTEHVATGSVAAMSSTAHETIPATSHRRIVHLGTGAAAREYMYSLLAHMQQPQRHQHWIRADQAPLVEPGALNLHTDDNQASASLDPVLITSTTTCWSAV